MQIDRTSDEIESDQPLPLAQRLDPRVTLSVFISLAVWIMTAPTIWAAALWLIVVYGVLAVVSRVGGGMKGGGALRSYLRFALPMAIVVWILYVLIVPAQSPPVWSWGPLSASREGMAFGALLALRFIAFVGLAGGLTLLTTPARLAAGVSRILTPLSRLGIRVASVYHLVLFIMRMFTVLTEEARIIRFGQQSRGVRFGGGLNRRIRSSAAIVVPVFAAAMRHSERLSLVLASRGFDPSVLPPAVLAMRLGRRDWMLMVGLAGLWFLYFATPCGGSQWGGM